VYPAAYESVLAVAASERGKKAAYSNYGTHIDLAVQTPEQRQVYTDTVATFHGDVTTETRIAKHGTSFSAPKLAGMLAEVWSSNPDMTREDILAVARDCCRPMDDSYYTAGQLGWGELSDWRLLVQYSQRARVHFSVFLATCILFVGSLALLMPTVVKALAMAFVLTILIVLTCSISEATNALQKGCTSFLLLALLGYFPYKFIMRALSLVGKPRRAPRPEDYVRKEVRRLWGMLGRLDQPADAVNRHRLLLGIVQETYKYRKEDVQQRDLCEQIAWQHLAEFPELAKALVVNDQTCGGPGTLPQVPTFQCLATLLTEKGEYDRAVEVCERALSFGLSDGTINGFKGRIERIRKKQRREAGESRES